MASLKDLRNRIASVKATRKITQAMQMVAAAKLRRAQEAATSARPYAQRMDAVLANLNKGMASKEGASPLLVGTGKDDVHLLVVMTAERGLCGGFNSNINRTAEKEAKARSGEDCEVVLDVIGRKGRDYLRRRPVTIRRELTGVYEKLDYSKAAEIGRDIVREYTGGGFDAVYLLYNEFKTVVTQKVVVEQLLPVQPEEIPEGQVASEFIFEPNKKALLDRLPAMYVELEVYRALLESMASELGARMTAMDNATKNADEMIDDLTLLANRARQAGITKELLEVVAGAAGLMK